MGCLVSCQNSDGEHDRKNYPISPNGSITVPETLQGWIPASNAHQDVYKKFTWNKQIGNGITSSVYQVVYNNELCALKRIEVS